MFGSYFCNKLDLIKNKTKMRPFKKITLNLHCEIIKKSKTKKRKQ